MKITADSHLDHSLTQSQIDYIAAKFADKTEFHIATFELPEELGQVPSALYGPLCGDPPVSDDVTIGVKRGAREYASRCVERHARLTRTVTVIMGPHKDDACILYTAFGGPLAPQEPDDPTCKDRDASRKFWSEHALATLPYDPEFARARERDAK